MSEETTEETTETEKTMEDMENDYNQTILEGQEDEDTGADAQDIDADEKVVDEKEPEESDAVKEIAKSIGWHEDFKAEDGEKEFVSATKFIKKSNEIQKTMREHIKKQKNDIETQRKQLTQLNKSLKQVQEYNKNIADIRTKSADKQIESLKKERITAIEDGDVDAVEDIESEIANLESGTEQLPDFQELETEPVEQEQEQEQQVDPAYTKWLGENQWYEKDPEMKKYADDIADSMPGAPFERLLTKISKDVREIYPDRFPNNNSSNRNNNVSSSGKTRVVNASTVSVKDLTAAQVNIMNQTIAKGIMTKKQYVQALQESGGIN